MANDVPTATAESAPGIDYLSFLKHRWTPLDFVRLDPQGWIAASRAAHGGDYTPMAAEIRRVVARRR